MKTKTNNTAINRRSTAPLILLFAVFFADSYAVQTYIGDADGFGFGDAAGLIGADGLAANRNENQLLDEGDYGKEHFVNFVYGDYDTDPMRAVVEGQSVTLLGNSDGGGLDGYVWRAYALVAWGDMLDGTVTMDIVAPREPYVVFGYAVLDIAPLEAKEPVHNPAPGAVLLGGIGVVLVGWLRRRRAFC